MPADELARAKNYVALRFPSGFETTGDISRRLEDMLVYNLPDDYFANYVQNIQAVTAADVQRVARGTSSPTGSPWSSSATAKTIEPGIRALEPRPDHGADDRRRDGTGSNELACSGYDLAFAPDTTSTTPPASAHDPDTGESGMVLCSSLVAVIGPISSTLSRLV